MSVILHAVPLAGVCRKERSSPVPQVRARPEEMRCVGSKRTPEVGRDMLLAASIVKFSGTKRPLGEIALCTAEQSRGRRRAVRTRHQRVCSIHATFHGPSTSRTRRVG